jgi:shikimate kinase
MSQHHIMIGAVTEKLLAQAQQLATQLGVPLYHLIHLIEQGETVSIETLIQDEGLDQYHHIATVYLESILRREPGVILISQELAERPENQDLINSLRLVPDLG